MPKAITDIFVGIWRFLKSFTRDFYTLLKFRGREFNEILELKYSNMVRAIIWLAIVLGTLGAILLAMTLASNFIFGIINRAGQTQPEPTPTLLPLESN